MSLPFEVPGPAYRARQVARWVYESFAATFDEMTDLPALYARIGRIRPEPEATRTADAGDTVKALFPGGYETVAMRYEDGRKTVCVSSQAGCGLGCTFCATG
ncbi:MAG: 23S rRNA (adenine(2503)-C2)-methyltransferase, partial [Actinobacteria bacterium]